MKINLNNKELDLERTLYSGQAPAFVFDKKNNYHYGYIWDKQDYKPLKICSRNNFLEIETNATKSNVKELLDLNRDLKEVYSEISTDKFISEKIKKFKGLRITKSEPLLTSLIFLSSQNNSMHNIKSFLNNLSKKFGRKIEFENNQIYLPPKRSKLFELKKEEFKECKAGYRAEYMEQSFKMIQEKQVNLEEASNKSHIDLKKELKKLHGVGDKVANCISLFGFRNLEAFPIDTHMKSIMQNKYLNKKTSKQEISEFAKDRWREFSGYAQQYLYMSQIS